MTRGKVVLLPFPFDIAGAERRSELHASRVDARLNRPFRDLKDLGRFLYGKLLDLAKNERRSCRLGQLADLPFQVEGHG